MLKQIIRHDLKLLAADKILFLVPVLLAAFVIYGVYNAARIRNEQAAATAAVANELNDKIETGEKTLLAAEANQTPETPPNQTAPVDYTLLNSVFGRVAAPPSEFAVMSVGQSDLLPLVTNRITLFQTNYNLFTNFEQSNPVNLLAGRFDLAFVIIYLFPLFVFALSYNLLAGERETGTLQLLLSQPVKLETLIFGKIVARFGLILAVALAVSLAAIFVSSINFSVDALTRLTLFAAAIFLYCLFWFLLAVFVNARGLSSVANAAFLIGCWLFFVVIVPTLLNLAVTAIYPLPSRLELIEKTRRVDLEAGQTREKLLDKFYLDNPQVTPQNIGKKGFLGGAYVAKLERERQVTPLNARYEQQLAAQQQAVRRLRFLSPAIAMQETLNDIAGTGTERHQHFVRQINEFFRQWNDFFKPRIFAEAKLTAQDYKQLPRFRFAEESAATIASRAGFGLLNLLIPMLFVGFLAIRALRRFKVAA